MPEPSEILAARLLQRRASQQQPQSPSGEPSDLTDIVRTVGEYGLGTVAAVGNYLDVGAGTVRNLIGGGDPFAAIKDPLKGSNRITGRELLTQWGITRRNREGGVGDWLKYPSEAVADAAGFGLEVLLDPLGPLGAPFKIPKLFAAGHRAAAKLAVAPIRATPIVGKAFDAGVGLAHRTAKRLFSSKVASTLQEDAQWRAEEFTTNFWKSQDQVLTRASAVADQSEKAKFSLRPEAPDYLENIAAIHRYYENTEDFAKQLDPNVRVLPDELKPFFDSLYSYMQEERTRSARLLKTPEFFDPAGIDYFPRYLQDSVKVLIEIEKDSALPRVGSRAFTTVDGATAYRDHMLKGFYEGTPGVNKLLKDQRWKEIIEETKQVIDSVGIQPGSVTARGVGLAGPRHLQNIAEAMEMSTDDLWRSLGLTLDQPYITTGALQAKLEDFKLINDRLAKTGQVASRHMRGRSGFLYDDLATGKGAALKFDASGNVTNLGGVQPTEHIGDREWDWLVDTLRGNPHALERIEEARKSGAQGFYSWKDKKGRPGFYVPRTQSLISNQWSRRVKSVLRKVKETPMSEEEIATIRVREGIAKEYGDQVLRDMPATDADGNFIYRSTITDEIKKVRPAQSMSPEFAAVAARRGLEPVMADKYEALADLIVNREKIRELGMFGNNPIVDWADHTLATARRTETAETLFKLVEDTFVEQFGEVVDGTGKASWAVRRIPSSIGDNFGGTQVKDLLLPESMIDQTKFLNELAVSLKKKKRFSSSFAPTKADVKAGKVYSKEFRNAVLEQIRLDPKVVTELQQMFQYYAASPEVQPLLQGIDSYMSIHKAGLLSTPATVMRDGLSAIINAFVRGDIKPYGSGIARMKDGYFLSRGRAAGNIDFPEVRQMAKSMGLDPEKADDRINAFVYMFTGASHKSHMHARLMNADIPSLATSGQVDSLLDALPNSRGEGVMESLHRMWGSQPWYQQFNPINTPGVMKKEGDRWVTNTNTNIWAGIHGAVRGTVDNAVRMASILTQMDDGKSFTEAFARTAASQINYDPRSFTRFEKSVMKRVFPFYSFISRSLPMVATELVTNPGGGMGQLIRAQRIAQGNEENYVPYDLQDTSAIPFGENAQGDLVYVRNLGLMHEDALNYLAPTQGVRGILQRVIGSSNPLVKGVIEYGTNTSTFFDGPMGGRRLDDLDPAVGRVLHNFGLTEMPPSGRPRPFISPLAEAAIANSPASALLRYAKIISEPTSRSPVPEKLVTMFSGLRTKHVNREQLIRELRDRLNAEQIAAGARPLTIVTGTEGLQQRYEESGDVATADRLRVITDQLQRLRNEIKASQKVASQAGTR